MQPAELPEKADSPGENEEGQSSDEIEDDNQDNPYQFNDEDLPQDRQPRPEISSANFGAKNIPNEAKSSSEAKTSQIEDNFRYDNMDFDQNLNMINRFFFGHLLLMAVKIKKVLSSKIPLKLHHLPNLHPDYMVNKKTHQFYDKLEKEKAKLESLPGKPKITPFKIFRLIMSCYKPQILCTFIYGIFDIATKMFNSVALNYCIQGLIDHKKDVAYAWAGALVGVMVLQSILRHQAWTQGQNLNSRFRLVLVNTIYQKINKLSSHAIREANIGKVINMVSSDLNSTEAKFFFLFQMALVPFTLTCGCIILGFRLGPLGLLSVAMLILVFPMQQVFGKLQSKYFAARIGKSDERVKLINESIDGIRLIKMYGWEEAFRKMVMRIRQQEIHNTGSSQTLQYIEKSISTTVVLIIAAITFIIIYYEGSYELNSAKIFSTIEMLQYMKVNVMNFSGQGFGYIFELNIFLKRFLDVFYIKEGEMIGAADSNEQHKKITAEEAIKFDNFNAYWKYLPQTQETQRNQTELKSGDIALTIQQGETDELKNSPGISKPIRPTLSNISLSIKRGELLGVVGKIGSGKSTLLQCLLKEIPFYEGYFEIEKPNPLSQQMAYVEQEPYIFSSTVRENILFGKEYDEVWYNTVVKNCCLQPDFKEMEKGDQTEIGEKGVNISGGQKARLCLARAVYSKADIYLLDDPLSAVDSKVAKKLFHNCIQGVLKGKTIILVTHQIHFTKNCDRILVLEDGTIKSVGHFHEMEGDLKKLAAGVLKFESKSQQSKSRNETVSHADSMVEKEEKKKKQQAENKLQAKIIKDEVKVTFSTYYRFAQIVSQVIWCFPFILLILFAAAECAFTAFSRALGYYDTTSDDSKDKLFGFWIGFSVLYLLINVGKYNLLARGTLIGSLSMHNKMFQSLTRAPVLFFDQTPGGFLMNKFSNDINIIDNILHFSANDAFDILSNFLNLLITCCVINPYVVIPGVIELFFLYFFFMWNKDIIVKSKQIDLAHKAPVFQFFQSTLQGVIPIKIYNQKANFLSKMEILCNNSVRTNITYWLAGRFFGVYVQYITIIGSGIGIFMIIAMSSSNPGLAGQSLTYFSMMTDSIQWCLRQLLNLDSVMSSCERAYHLMDQPSEAPFVTQYDVQNNLVSQNEHPHVKPSNKHKQSYQQNASIWPSEGKLELKNCVMRYSKDLNPVLKGLSFVITPGQKVGCIGRTGAGKSSILQALFRMTECEGDSKIIFDGIDTSLLGLHTLRQKISIIPQVPFVFAGTIRRNIDPLEEHSDEKIWESLKLVELDQYVKDRCQNGIQTDMSDVSSIFSVGQKQLICLARAVLKDNKLLVLDEATANVDMETDNLIQKTIRTKFSTSSVLTIAHRLNTIADYDKVIVMDDGKVAECDEPFKLLASSIEDEQITRNTIFAQMVLNTGQNNSSHIFNAAKAKFLENQSEL